MIVHQATAFGVVNRIDPRRLGRDLAPTNRLRTEATDHLLSAGQAVGVQRFVAQSFAERDGFCRNDMHERSALHARKDGFIDGFGDISREMEPVFFDAFGDEFLARAALAGD